MKISIITVTWNSESTLKDTMESVLKQTYTDYEYLIVDGSSEDNTINIVKEYELKFNGRLKWISEKDEGIYDAMNKGIKMATGEVVGIINSDDMLRGNDVFEKISKAFDDDETLQCTFSDLCFVNSGNLNKVVRFFSAKGWKPWKFRFGLMPPHPTFYCRKHNFDKFGYYKIDYKIAADYELMLRFLWKNNLKYKYLPQSIVTMRNGGVSTNGWYNILIVNNREPVRACKENGYYTNILLILTKYFSKILGLRFF